MTSLLRFGMRIRERLASATYTHCSAFGMTEVAL